MQTAFVGSCSEDGKGYISIQSRFSRVLWERKEGDHDKCKDSIRNDLDRYIGWENEARNMAKDSGRWRRVLLKEGVDGRTLNTRA